MVSCMHACSWCPPDRNVHHACRTSDTFLNSSQHIRGTMFSSDTIAQTRSRTLVMIADVLHPQASIRLYLLGGSNICLPVAIQDLVIDRMPQLYRQDVYGHTGVRVVSRNTSITFKISVCVTRRKLQRPGTAKEGKNTEKERTATINQNDRQPAPLTHYTLTSTAKSTHESTRRTPTSTATLHTRQMHWAHTTQTQHISLCSVQCTASTYGTRFGWMHNLKTSESS